MADFLTIAHEVADFEAWKAAHDADAPNRVAAGLSDLLCLRDSEKPYLVALIFGVAGAGRALAMAGSPAFSQTMKRAGVIGAPFVSLRTGEFAPNGASTYLTLNFKVSGIETFRAGYAMDAADRKAASLTDLAVLQKPDDPNNLFLIWSVGDVEAVKAFMASPALAEHQVKNAGVVSTPASHIWTAV